MTAWNLLFLDTSSSLDATPTCQHVINGAERKGNLASGSQLVMRQQLTLHGGELTNSLSNRSETCDVG